MTDQFGRIAGLIRAFLVLLCICTALSSCQWLSAGRSSSVGQGMSFGMLSDPFKPVDPINFTRAKAASALMEYRVKPAAAVVGPKPLNLKECRDIALGTNLELQAARLEELSRRALECSNRTKLLPHFMFSAELSNRDNLPYSYSDQGQNQGLFPDFPLANAPQGTVSNWSLGRERSTYRQVLETRWSPTDAALAYYVTLSSGNDKLAAHFQKVRVAQKLVGVIDSAFFRLLSLQQCLPMAKSLLGLRSDISSRMEGLLDRQLRTVEDCERARQSYVKAKGLLALLENERDTQINILASAMGVSPDECAGLAVNGLLPLPRLDECITSLEMMAVQNRPEAYQAGLSNLNSMNDLKRSIVKQFPKVTGFWRTTHDKDKYSYNKDWNEVGMLIYFDLWECLSGIGEWKASNDKAVKTDREIAAVALGITSQVRIAALKGQHAITQFKDAESAVSSAQKVYQAARRSYSANASDKLSTDEANANYLGEEISRLRALGEANAMMAELYAAMGTNYNEPQSHD